MRRLVLVLLLTQNNGICKVNNNKQQEPCLATLLSWKLEASKNPPQAGATKKIAIGQKMLF